MTTRSLLIVLFFISSSILASGAEIYVSTSGKAGATGTKDSPFASLADAAAKAQSGDVIRVAGGTYKSDKGIPLAKNGSEGKPIRVEPADDVRPIFDFSAEEFGKGAGVEVRGDWWQVVGIEVMGAGRQGILITGHHNVIEKCVAHENQDTGIHIGAPGSNNLILNCDSYRNIDRPTRGENADGFGCKFNVGPGNVFRGCRAWENADDGFDLWKAPFPVRIENSVAFRNGLNLWDIQNWAGNGNGFKLGGDYVPAAHVVVNCVAMDQPVRGFDQNNNMGPLTVENCTALRCRFGFAFVKVPTAGGTHVLKHNMAFDAPVRLVAGTVDEDNKWMDATGAMVKAAIAPATRPASQPAQAGR